MATELLAIVEISSSQSQKYVSHNEGLHHLEVHITGVLDRDNSGPPGSPSAGDAYIVDSATGVWSTATVNDVAYYYGTSPAWNFYTPTEGVTLHIADEHRDYVFDGADWVPAHRESGISLLSRTTGCEMYGAPGNKTNLFTVPTGKKCIITSAVIRNPSASLAGGTDFDMGDGANADTWKQTIDLSAMTSTSGFYIVTNENTAEYTTSNPLLVFDATDVFGIKPVTGATSGSPTATIDLFGYLYDA